MTIQLPSQGIYRIDTFESRVDLRAKHRFGTGTVRASFGVTDGEISVGSPLENSVVQASASSLSFESGSKARDRKVKSKAFLDGATYPAISFASTSFRQVDGVWHLGGTLTARGESAATDFRLESLEFEPGAIRFVATGKVDRYAHGITAAKGMAGRYLELTITGRARLQD